MNQKELLKKLKALNSVIEDYIDNIDMAEADEKCDEKSDKKTDDKED